MENRNCDQNSDADQKQWQAKYPERKQAQQPLVQ